MYRILILPFFSFFRLCLFQLPNQDCFQDLPKIWSKIIYLNRKEKYPYPSEFHRHRLWVHNIKLNSKDLSCKKSYFDKGNFDFILHQVDTQNIIFYRFSLLPPFAEKYFVESCCKIFGVFFLHPCFMIWNYLLGCALSTQYSIPRKANYV